MLIIPAIDIKDGKCVRLTEGKADTAVVYDDNPVTPALSWQKGGAQYLHIVDLDGAFADGPKNFGVIQNMLRKLDIPAQVGGGIRSLENIKAYIDAGADRIILGTKAADSGEFLKKALELYGGKIAVAIDSRNGKVAVRGWTKETDLLAAEFVLTLKKQGVSTVVYTDITVDGTLKGPNFTGIKEFLKSTDLNVIISGGIKDIDDLKNLKEIGEIYGVIVGKALYEGKINLKDALTLSGK